MREFLLKISIWVIYPLIACLISMALTALCIRILPKLGFVDTPGGRHIHRRIVPRGGGIAVVLAVFFSIAAYALASGDAHAQEVLMYTTLPGLLLTVTGLFDDRIGLRSLTKLLAQIAAAVLLWYGAGMDLSVCGYMLPWYLSLPLTVLWIVGVINAFNMIDGLDGLAAGLAVISGTCLSVWFIFRNVPNALFMLIFVGACLGFLRYNFAPAKIFLGDTGSMFLGMFLAVSGGGVMDHTATFTSLLLPPLIIGVPLFDMVLAVLRRSVRKWRDPEAAGLMDADSDHLHHRIFRASGSHSKAAGKMYVVSVVFALLAVLLLFLRDRASAVALVLILLTVLVMLRRLAVVELYDSMSFLREKMFSPRKSLLISALHPLADMATTGAAAAVFCWIAIGKWNFPFVVYSMIAVMGMLIVTGCYRVYWLRASMGDRFRLFIASAAGTLLASAVHLVIRWSNGYGGRIEDFISGAVLFALAVPLSLSLERFLLHYLESAWLRRFMMDYQRRGGSRVLAIGGGLQMRLLTGLYNCSQRGAPRERIIGCADDDVSLKGKRCYDIPVLGSTEELEQIWQNPGFDEVMIATAKLSAAARERVIAFCRKRQIPCSDFVLEGAGLEKLAAPGGLTSRQFNCSRVLPFADALYIAAAAMLCGYLSFHSCGWFYPVCAVAVTMVWLVIAGSYRVNWMRAGISDRWKLVKNSVASAVVFQSVWMCLHLFVFDKAADLHMAVNSVIYILLISGGLQFSRLLLHPGVFYALRNSGVPGGEKVLIYSAGVCCRIYIQALMAMPAADKPQIAGIVDDDDVLQGLRCNGVPVLGGLKDLENIYKRKRFDRIVVASARISGSALAEMFRFVSKYPVQCSFFSVRKEPVDGCANGEKNEKTPFLMKNS